MKNIIRKMIVACAIACTAIAIAGDLASSARKESRIVAMTELEFEVMVKNLRERNIHVFTNHAVTLIVTAAIERVIWPVPRLDLKKKRSSEKKAEPRPYLGQQYSSK